MPTAHTHIRHSPICTEVNATRCTLSVLLSLPFIFLRVVDAKKLYPLPSPVFVNTYYLKVSPTLVYYSKMVKDVDFWLFFIFFVVGIEGEKICLGYIRSVSRLYVFYLVVSHVFWRMYDQRQTWLHFRYIFCVAFGTINTSPLFSLCEARTHSDKGRSRLNRLDLGWKKT